MLKHRVDTRYSLREQIGAGGMGSVFRAEDRLTGTIVALKRVTAPTLQLSFGARTGGLLAGFAGGLATNVVGQAGTDDDRVGLRLALAQEFQTLASLRHPNIISVLDYGFDDGLPFFTMDYLADARPILAAGRDQPLAGRIDLLVQVLQALHYLHQHGIIHRDLKPDNILVTAENQVKVLDFGLSVYAADAIHTAGSMTGTVAYMAPEVLRGEPARELSDLYAFGVIAYELIAEHYPFPADTLDHLFRRILTEPPDLAPLFELEQSPETRYSLAMIVHGLLAKNPAERYQSAQQVTRELCAAVGKPVPEESLAIRDSFLQTARFVGREVELARLDDALHDLLDGHGSLWLVGGESGVGKTRLLDELRARALVSGALVLRSSGISEGGAPLHLWRGLLRRLALISDLTDAEAGVLKALAPDIEALIGRDVPDAPPLSDKASYQRINVTLVNVLKRHPFPTLLILEDLQWTPNSFDVLISLMPALDSLPLMIVGSYRNDERPDLPDELPAAHVITLKRFPAEITAQLSESMVGKVGRNPDLLALIQRETEGNAFFIVETMRALAEEAGQLSAIGQIDLPRRVVAGGIQQVIERRLDRVPLSARPILKLAAVAGRQVDPDLLRAVGVVGVESWLTTCASAAVFTVDDGRWQFAHDKLREAMLDRLSDDERTSIHQQIAIALEHLHPDDPAYAMRLVEHWRQAGDAEREIQYAVVASQQALASSAYDAAVDIAAHALAHYPAGAVTDVQMMLQQISGDAYSGISNYARAQACYEASLALARALGSLDGETLALNGLGRCALRHAKYTDAYELFSQALELARAHHNYREESSALRGIGGALYFLNDYDRALAYHQAACDTSRLSEDAVEIAESLTEMGVFAELLNSRDALAYFREGLEIAESIGDRHLIASCCCGIGVEEVQLGQFDSALPLLERSLALHREINDRFGIGFCYRWMTWRHVELGEYPQALATCAHALEAYRASGVYPAVIETLCQTAFILIKQGEIIPAQRHLQQAHKIAARMVNHRVDLLIVLTYACLLVVLRQPLRALEILIMAQQQPPARLNMPARLRGDLERTLSSLLTRAEIDAVYARETTLDVPGVLREIDDFLVQSMPAL